MPTITNSTVPGPAPAFVGAADRASGIEGTSNSGSGVHGVSKAGPLGPGIFYSEYAQGAGVRGDAPGGIGVLGKSKDHSGVVGESDTQYGVVGESTSGVGVYGSCQTNEAIHGVTNSSAAAAVIGINNSTGPGVRGVSRGFDGVSGESQGEGKAGVAGFSANGIGVYGRGRLAGFFEGVVEVKGDIRLTNGDCAEDFDVHEGAHVEPGTVMVLGEDGRLHPSHKAYDKCVAGVISGAGEYKPAIVLDNQQSQINRKPIALLGKVFCKVDAQYGAIEVGDLLTTSPTPGNAMKAFDPLSAFGAVVGKALRPLKEGQGLIPILVALQ